MKSDLSQDCVSQGHCVASVPGKFLEHALLATLLAWASSLRASYALQCLPPGYLLGSGIPTVVEAIVSPKHTSTWNL